MAQNVIFAALAIAIGMIAACITDMVIGFPFDGQTFMDVVFVIASGIVIWMAIDAMRGIRRR